MKSIEEIYKGVKIGILITSKEEKLAVDEKLKSEGHRTLDIWYKEGIFYYIHPNKITSWSENKKSGEKWGKDNEYTIISASEFLRQLEVEIQYEIY